MDAVAATMTVLPTAPNVTPARLREIETTARDFEAMFFAQMMAPVWESAEPDAYFGGGAGEETFRGLMLQEYGKAAAAGDGLGIAAHVKEALLRYQERDHAG